MKTINKILFLCGIILLTTCSCDKSKDDAIPVEFKFRLLNEQGQETTVFNEGENIIFSFQVLNKSSVDLILENFFPNDDFFRIYQITKEGIVDQGTVYDGYAKIGSYAIKSNDIFELKCPLLYSNNRNFYCAWLLCEENHSVLTKGNFYTKFSQSFKIGEKQTEEKYFEIKFTVQ